MTHQKHPPQKKLQDEIVFPSMKKNPLKKFPGGGQKDRRSAIIYLDWPDIG